ncbi:hypothetical protein B9Z55_027932 [Caenorhabditis nigoni]|uniref:Uncharacterized protein n=1 Tax=Caenorhabditis nigoni TaxID=1611254 RepID=A0A2G5SDA8_9PELO|nr:hypothetical protein B9Z55_027932 [Caenorhabditis nigoni]
MRQAEKEMARWEDFLELEEYREKQKEIEEFQRFCREYPEHNALLEFYASTNFDSDSYTPRRRHSYIENLQETAFLNVPDDRLDELPDDEQERLISRLMRVYRRYFD